jgi:hypothetical protein
MLSELKQRFPYQFEGKNIGISIARGWDSLFTKLCEDIDAITHDDPRGSHYGLPPLTNWPAAWARSPTFTATIMTDLTTVPSAPGLVSMLSVPDCAGLPIRTGGSSVWAK